MPGLLSVTLSAGMLAYAGLYVFALRLLRRRLPTVRSMQVASLVSLLGMGPLLLLAPGAVVEFSRGVLARVLTLVQPAIVIGAGIGAANLLAGRLSKDLYRVTFHITAGVLILYFLSLDPDVALVVAALALSLFTVAEYVRTAPDENAVTAFVRRVFGAALRTSELERYLPTFYFLGGCLAVVLLLPADQAWASVAMLTFGDSSAALVGGRLGKRRLPHNPQKTYLGTGAMVLAGVLVLLALGYLPLRALSIALAAAVVESLPLGQSDNLLIPLATGSLLSAPI
ncbi:MAG: hypothetical protein HY558_06865 [Euryarchaeota archaeon]|nr:hypothetical protein [Euryarchaeota archaeon]